MPVRCCWWNQAGARCASSAPVTRRSKSRCRSVGNQPTNIASISPVVVGFQTDNRDCRHLKGEESQKVELGSKQRVSTFYLSPKQPKKHQQTKAKRTPYLYIKQETRVFESTESDRIKGGAHSSLSSESSISRSK